MTILSSLLLLSIPILLGTLLREPIQYPANMFLASGVSTNRYLLVTAHPDDESMFFGPTILALRKAGVELHTLCLSTGNAEGLGVIRSQELTKSLDILGVPAPHRHILDEPDLQDHLEWMWPVDKIAEVVKSYVEKHAITTILTFDVQGISRHPNHRSIPIGISAYISSLPFDPPRPRLYTLITVPVPVKFFSVLSPILAKWDLLLGRMQQSTYRFVLRKLTEMDFPSKDEPPANADHYADVKTTVPVFVSGFEGYCTAVTATFTHRSQMVWFRWLYLGFSRYMWVNEWSEGQFVH